MAPEACICELEAPASKFLGDNGDVLAEVHRSPHDGAPFVYGLDDPQVVRGLEDPNFIPRDAP